MLTYVHKAKDDLIIRPAIIGAGEWVKDYHLPTIKYLEEKIPLQISGIWNRTQEKAVRLAQIFQIKKVYTSFNEIIADSNINSFIVLVNPSVIPQVIKKLLVRKLPIFSEKTPGKTFKEAKELSKIVNVPNVVAFNRRYMPINQRFKRIIDNIKNIYFTECHFYRNERLYKNFMIETGIHGINYMEYLFGKIKNVRTDRRKNPVNDTYIWISNITFEAGLKGIMKFFPCSGSCVERFEAHSNDTSVYLYSPQTYAIDYPGKIVVHKRSKLHEIIHSDEKEGPLFNSGFVNEYMNFFNAITNNTQTISNFQNACNSMRIAEAIEKGIQI